VVRSLPAERAQAHIDQDQVFVNNLIKNFNRHGITFPIPSGVVANLMESLFFVGIHRHDLGEDAYLECTDILADLIARYSPEGAT
jgi:hypothetical protein